MTTKLVCLAVFDGGPNHKCPFLSDVTKNFFPCLSPGVRGALALRVFVGSTGSFWPFPAWTPTHNSPLGSFPPRPPGAHQPCSFSGRYRCRSTISGPSPATTTGLARTGFPSGLTERPMVSAIVRCYTSVPEAFLAPLSFRGKLLVLSARRPK